jgi:hypothetical protein
VRATSPETLAQHPLPQSTLHVPLFAGVEAPVLGFEVVALAVAAHVVGLLWAPLMLIFGVLAGFHVLLATSTAKDRRLSMVFARSLRYPAYARPWATETTFPRTLEPTLPRRLLA